MTLGRCLLVLAVVLAVAAKGAKVPKAADIDEKDVVVLTEANFDGIIEKNELVLVEFYAPWCGHCKSLAPEYAVAATAVKEKGIVLAKVDVTEQKALGSRFNIEGFPTIKLFRSGEPAEYEGGRTSADITAFLLKQQEPAVAILGTGAELDAFTTDKVVVIGFTAAGSVLESFLTSFANKNREEFTFGTVADGALAAAKGEAMETVVVFKPFDERKAVFSGGLDNLALTTFLKMHSLKLVDEIGPKNYKAYVGRAVPIAWLFVDPEDTKESDSAKAAMVEVATPYRERFSFVYISGVEYKQMATKMGVSGEVWPTLAIEDKDGQHYVFDEQKKITTAHLQEFLQGVTTGELKPTVKSEAIPASQPGDDGVVYVVGEQFAQIVMDTNKDVLMEFYAPWCGHCKKLTPIYSALAKRLAHVKTLVIAKSDATLNDFPKGFKVESFPTIKLVTASNQIIDYEGERDAEGFLKFLQANVEHKFTVPAKAAAGKASKDEL